MKLWHPIILLVPPIFTSRLLQYLKGTSLGISMAIIKRERDTFITILLLLIEVLQYISCSNFHEVRLLVYWNFILKDSCSESGYIQSKTMVILVVLLLMALGACVESSK